MLWAESASSEHATRSASSATAAVRRVRPCRCSMTATETAVSAQKYGLRGSTFAQPLLVSFVGVDECASGTLSRHHLSLALFGIARHT